MYADIHIIWHLAFMFLQWFHSSLIFHVCFLLVKFTGKPAPHVTLMTVCPPGKGGAFLPSDLRSFYKKIYISWICNAFAVYMQSQEMDFWCFGMCCVATFDIHCTLCFLSKESSHSMFIVYHLYYCGEERIFCFSSVSFFHGASITLTDWRKTVRGRKVMSQLGLPNKNT